MKNRLKTLEEILNPRRPFRRRRRGWNPRRKRMGVIRKLRPFVTRSNRKRASEVIKLRNKLRLRRHIYGGRFIGTSDLVDPERPILYKQEAQVFFPGTDKRVLWNVQIATARKAFWDEVGDMALKRTAAMLPREKGPFDIRDMFEPVSFNAWGQATSYTMRERNETYEELGGMTRREFEAQLEKKIIASEPPEIYESFSIDRGYEYGIGLHVVVDSEMIDRETVERVIDRFFAVGETDWRAESPVPRDRLPFETEMEALMTIPEEQR
ncbi:conserved hypothetical protein [uncultured delta proteobacterium]|uniref:Uncharacterized protein n=1 Tax=uncultured delta proteobacterium TaxID=34034 RepID=A0A212KH61_9DELT|nr:conserved hypothetical protein [uncultured delta proteobacterium]